MPDNNPLIEAMQMKRGPGPDLNDPQALLEFILSKFDLVPKEAEQEESPIVTTQESHSPS